MEIDDFTDVERNIYGWDMRIMQSEEDIFILKRRLEEMIIIRDGLAEQLTQSKPKEKE